MAPSPPLPAGPAPRPPTCCPGPSAAQQRPRAASRRQRPPWAFAPGAAPHGGRARGAGNAHPSGAPEVRTPNPAPRKCRPSPTCLKFLLITQLPQKCLLVTQAGEVTPCHAGTGKSCSRQLVTQALEVTVTQAPEGPTHPPGSVSSFFTLLPGSARLSPGGRKYWVVGPEGRGRRQGPATWGNPPSERAARNRRREEEVPDRHQLKDLVPMEPRYRKCQTALLAQEREVRNQESENVSKGNTSQGKPRVQ